MKTYRQKLIVQNIFSLIGILAVAAVMAFEIYFPKPGLILTLPNFSRWRDFFDGFLGGVGTAFAALLILNIILNLRAMRSEARLKAMYIKEHDERKRQIWLLSGANAYWFDVFGLLLAAIVLGHFSMTAFFCLLSCLFYICIVRIILKLYYSKKI